MASGFDEFLLFLERLKACARKGGTRAERIASRPQRITLFMK